MELQEQLGAAPRGRDAHAVEPARVEPLPDGLTAREAEVLALIAAGRTNKEIAEDLVLSIRTVDHHTAAIYRKIGARRRADAAAYAFRHGLASEPASA
jgi:DNA-binding NarL/FixJ family response regulator